MVPIARIALVCCLLLTGVGAERAIAGAPARVPAAAAGLLSTEKIPGTGVWVDPSLEARLEDAARVRATVWFEDQFLADGSAYRRRMEEFAAEPRTKFRAKVIETLRALSRASHGRVEKEMAALLASGAIRNLERHWIVNGFSCGVTKEGLPQLRGLAGVRKIFQARWGGGGPAPQRGDAPGAEVVSRPSFDPGRYKHPWYIRQLLVDKVWRELHVTGKGTLNVVHDFNFLFSPNLSPNVYRNESEIPFNGIDDDENGLVDDYHGYHFDHGSGALTVQPVGPDETSGAKMHGFMCAAIICGAGAEGAGYEFGIAPEARWAGVATGRHLERAIEWALEQGADTYSMSFSQPDQGEYRSHRRKMMEHGAFGGLYFVSGAGNFALQQEVPLQMRQPEDIPLAVFAAAGVQRDLGRTAFSSKGPVLWKTEHYDEGLVDKPAVCAFNANLPYLKTGGGVTQGGLGGNSFAGPMFCGVIALMLSADPDLQPWALREIITATALDVAAEGYDHETGHGLINAYRAVKEVLRRKAKRESQSLSRYSGRTKGDVLDVGALAKSLEQKFVSVMRVGSKGQAAALGVRVGDRLLRYGDTPITSRSALRAAKRSAAKSGLEEIPAILLRGEERIEVVFNPGQLGIHAADSYEEPTFQ